MVWKEKYNVGVNLIDEQHQELFQRVEDFLVTLRGKVSWEEKVDKVNETLEFMKEYVVTHFEDEEAYQREIGYPGYEEHCKIHSDMVNFVGEVVEKYSNEGFKEELAQQFAGKLLAWLINHVTVADQKIAEYAKSMEGNK